MFTFKNRHGTAILLPVSEPQNINTVTPASVAEENKFSLDHGEQLSLITDNRRIQISADWCGTPSTDWRLYVVYHITSSLVVVCRVAYLAYRGKNPAAEIQRSRLS